MLKKIKMYLSYFFNFLIIDGRKSFREIKAYLSEIEKEVNSLYDKSFEDDDLFGYEVTLDMINGVKKKTDDVSAAIKKNLDDDREIKKEAEKNMMIASFATVIGFLISMLNAPFLIGLSSFMVPFLLSYRYAKISDSFNQNGKVYHHDKLECEERNIRCQNTIGNAKRNVTKKINECITSTKPLSKSEELAKKMEEVLKEYFDSGNLKSLSDEEVKFLVTSLQAELDVKSNNLFELLDLKTKIEAISLLKDYEESQKLERKLTEKKGN